MLTRPAYQYMADTVVGSLSEGSTVITLNISSACLDEIHPELTPPSTELEFLLLSPIQYGIVLDAGSSHTALYIYEWPAEKDNNTGRVEQTHSCKVKGTVCCHIHRYTHTTRMHCALNFSQRLYL